jgi:hypothetical protein
MRAIALRVAPSDLAPFWSLASSEMLKVFLGETHADSMIFAAAKKLLALFRILRPAAFLDVFVALSPRSTEIKAAESAHHEQALQQRQDRLQRLQEDGSDDSAELPPDLQDGILPTVAEVEQSIITDLALRPPESADN